MSFLLSGSECAVKGLAEAATSRNEGGRSHDRLGRLGAHSLLLG